VKRISRRLFNAAAIASLLTFVATAFLWFFSYFQFESVSSIRYLTLDGRGAFTDLSNSKAENGIPIAIQVNTAVSSLRGEITFSRERFPTAFLPALPGLNWLHLPAPTSRSKPNLHLGVAWELETHPDAYWFRFMFPIWWISAVSAALPLMWVVHLRKHRWRVAQSVCAHCGYDLRATPGRCPECGNVVK